MRVSLSEEIRRRNRRLRQLMFEYHRIKQELQYQVSPINLNMCHCCFYYQG